MENILLNVWIEMKNGIKVRLVKKDVYNSDEKYILIMEINENEAIRSINLMVKGRKVFCKRGTGVYQRCGNLLPDTTTDHGKMMITKQFINAWLGE